MGKISTRENFTATFIRKSISLRFNTNRILLGNIKNNEGIIIIKEIWVNETKSFETLGKLKYGDTISFVANYDVIENSYNKKIKRILSRLNNVKIIDEKKDKSAKIENYNNDVESLLKKILKNNKY